jgi:transcriptional regulator with XRE-family HTH domain
VAEAADLLRAARKTRNLTQSQLASRVRLDQGDLSRSERGRRADYRTVDRILAGVGHRLYAVPTRRDDAVAAAAAIKRRLLLGDRDGALRVLLQLSDDLGAEHGLVRGVLAVGEPEPTGEAVWDAAIAAVVVRRLAEEGLPSPAWVDGPTRRLARPATLEVDPADPVPPLSAVPPEFAARGVLVWSDTFESV